MSTKTILVVCIGNICRSPMAQALLAAGLPGTRVISAGIAAMVGEPPDAIAQQLMAARSLDISAHRAQQLNRMLCHHADVILVMDLEQRRHLEAQYPLITGKVYRLNTDNQDIPDPYRKSREMFELSLGLIESGVNAWMERLKRV